MAASPSAQGAAQLTCASTLAFQLPTNRHAVCAVCAVLTPLKPVHVNSTMTMPWSGSNKLVHAKFTTTMLSLAVTSQLLLLEWSFTMPAAAMVGAQQPSCYGSRRSTLMKLLD